MVKMGNENLLIKMVFNLMLNKIIMIIKIMKPNIEKIIIINMNNNKIIILIQINVSINNKEEIITTHQT
jgi:hypothetical protein